MEEKTYPHPPWVYDIIELDINNSLEASYRLQVKFDDMMKDGEFNLIDCILYNTKVWTISVNLMIGLLTCSSWCKDKLTHRKLFVKRCRAELIDRGRKDVNELMVGLE